MEMRKAIKKPLTDRALEMMLKKVNEMSEGDMNAAKAIIDQSTMNSWQGVFPLKNSSKSQSRNLSGLFDNAK